MHKYRKPLLFLCLLGVLLYIALEMYKRFSAPIDIEVIEVSAGNAQQVLAVVGRVRTKNVVNVRVQFAGAITAMLVDEGDRVKRGEIIAQVRSAAEQAALAMAEADLLAFAAQFEFSQQEFTRISTLSKQGLAAILSLDEARTNLKSAEAKLSSAQQARNKAAIIVNDFSVQSPIDGTVLSRPIDQGQVVGLQDTVFQIGSDGPVEIEAEVDEVYAQDLALEMTAILAPTGKRQNAEGRITEISPRVNPLNGSRLTRLMLNVPNSDFIPGRSIDVNIRVRSFDDALSVPRSALHKQGDTWFVYTIVKHKISARAVTFIDWPGNSVVLQSGLVSGTWIIRDAAIALVAQVDNQDVSAKKVQP